MGLVIKSTLTSPWKMTNHHEECSFGSSQEFYKDSGFPIASVVMWEDAYLMGHAAILVTRRIWPQFSQRTFCGMNYWQMLYFCYHEGRRGQWRCPSDKILNQKLYGRIFSNIWQKGLENKYIHICLCVIQFHLSGFNRLFRMHFIQLLVVWISDMISSSGSDVKCFFETTFLWTNKCHTPICSFVMCCSHFSVPRIAASFPPFR